MVEGARLESVYTGNRIEGSNPSLSASQPKPPLGGYLFQDEPGLPERNREINRPGTKFRHGL